MTLLIQSSDLHYFGIYKITNTVTNDFYIGSTLRTFKTRFLSHTSQYKRFKEGARNNHPKLNSAYNKYGFENFTFEILLKVEDKSFILKEEERLINLLNPKYNICREPTKGGSPNKGRKLTSTWKENIGKRSAKYKHSENVLKLKTLQNKELSSKYRIFSKEESFEGSLIDCSKFCGYNHTSLLNWVKNKSKNKKWSIEKLKSQKKQIEVCIENEIFVFKSFSECDRHFLMWRGYTSTKTLRKELLMDKYTYKII